MSSKRILAVALAAMAIAGASPAFAGSNDWGTVEQARVCLKEFDETRGNSATWGGNVYQNSKLVAEGLKSGKASAECKAEVDRRGEICKTENKASPKNVVDRCNSDAFFAICDQLLNDPERQKREEEKKKAEEKKAREAELAKVELPKAVKKDPAIEKQIAAAYKAEYPDNTVLMVILQSKDWSTERSNYGVITNRNIQAMVINKQKDGSCQIHNEAWTQEYNGKKFAGKLGQRGAGSQSLSGILCEKVPAAKGKGK